MSRRFSLSADEAGDSSSVPWQVEREQVSGCDGAFRAAESPFAILFEQDHRVIPFGEKV